MTNEELVRLIQQGIDPTDNIEQLYNQNHNYIWKIARKYAQGDDMDDLMQEAYFGLYEAIKRYEETAGVLFLSYASFWIRQVIKRYQDNCGRCVRLPVGLQGLMYKYKRITGAYLKEFGRSPTTAELCYYLEVSEKVLEGVSKAVAGGDIKSLDEIIPGTDDFSRGDSIEDPEAAFEDNVIDRMNEEAKKAELWKIVENNLSKEQNTTIVSRYRDNLTLSDTGKLLGVTRERVRQHETRALKILRLPRVVSEMENKFEINMAKAYQVGVKRFKETGSSIVEDIATRRIYYELESIKSVIWLAQRYNHGKEYLLEHLSEDRIKLAINNHLLDEDLNIISDQEAVRG